MRLTIATVLLVLLALASSARAADAPPQQVKAQLLADVKQIVPGKPFQLGVLLTIDPGWHVYWLNPGDSGLATKITLQLPKGFTAGEVQFPTPIEIVDPGNIKVYGYTDDVMFIATVTPDAKLAPGDADLSAKVNYLVCKDDCIPGKATPELKMPIAAAGAHVEAANETTFADWKAQLPVAPDRSPLVTNFQPLTYLDQQKVDLQFQVSWVAGDPQIFPWPNDDVEVLPLMISGRRMHNSGPEWINLQVKPLAGHKMPKAELPLVIGFTTAGGQRRGIVVQIDLSKFDDKSAKN